MISSRTQLRLLLPAFVLTACSSPEADAAGDVSTGEASFVPRLAVADRPGLTLGTLDAMIDGVATRLYVVSGEVEGTPYASATWFGSASETLTFSLGAIATPNPHFDTFRRGPAGTTSMGDYDGPALVITATLSGRLGPTTIELPSSDAFASVVYMTRAIFDDPTVMYLAETGSIDISSIHLGGDGLRVDGTFHGTAVNPATGAQVDILDGRFHVSTVPHVSDITPPGG